MSKKQKNVKNYKSMWTSLKRFLKGWYPPGKGICGTDAEITTSVVLNKMKKLEEES